MDVLSDTESLKKAVDPLYLPFTKVGTVRVVDSFNVIFVCNLTSNKEMSH